ncbi:MAG: hypothetical protein H6895_14250 [Defluviimonas sp.]|nr:hypothetical protein [Defluviimonas sp.]
MARTRLFALAAAALLALSACGPVIVGAGGAVLADKVAEDKNGGDGLF